VQSVFAGGLERFIERRYQPILRAALRNKFITLTVAVSAFLLSVGYCSGGRIQQTFLPKVDSDVIIAEADLPFGAPVERSKELLELMISTANETLAEFGGDELERGLFAQFGGQGTGRQGDPAAAAGQASGSHLVEVALYLVESDKRPMTGAELARRWRARLEKRAAGLEALRFRYATGPSGGKPVHVELSHPDQRHLEEAAAVLAGKLADFTGTYDIDDGFARGKPQLDFTLTPEARSLGVTELSLARQLRSAFFGAEAVRQQRGREEVRVYVRLPDSERDSEYHVERLMIRTPGGGEIPLAEAAEIERGRAYTEINRTDARRTMTVTSEVDLALGSADKINAQIAEEAMPDLVEAYPGLTWSFGGEQREQGDVNKSLFSGFAIALVAMFALLAISFRSYRQPLIVMLAIPFGFVGALWGHVIMGYGWSLMSLMGIVALSGIVINDSLILVVAINRYYREQGMPLYDAVVAGGLRRFRPILLTSLTTFFGLAPMILETSVQARFLIPMAVSLGFGVMVATFITLLLVPAAYVILEENILGGWQRYKGAWREVLGGQGGARSDVTDSVS
jgi:multidrug efflux pump subunit AcrB